MRFVVNGSYSYPTPKNRGHVSDDFTVLNERTKQTTNSKKTTNRILKFDLSRVKLVNC